MFNRLVLQHLSKPINTLILGPRQTGKTTLLKEIKTLAELNFLSNSCFLKYNLNPDLLYEEIGAFENKNGIVWIDEVQKVPAILGVVHRCIEEFKETTFYLTGSSARKLKKGAANLLGGRALNLSMHPLSIFELGELFDLSILMEFGSLPKIYTLAKISNEQTLAKDLLRSYVETYIQEEIKSEALVRNLASFQRFLEVSAFQFGQEINFSAIADDCQVGFDLVKDYYSILEDTLIGFFLQPYHQSPRKRFSQRPKFYFFDNGVTRAMLGTLSTAVTNLERGKLYEQFIIQELRRINDYYRKDLKFYLWKTSNGTEVDIVVERGGKLLLAIECKSSSQIANRDLSGIQAFSKQHTNIPAYICAPVEHDRKHDSGFLILRPNSLFAMVRDL